MSGPSFFSLPTLLAAAIFSLVAAVPLQAPPQGKDAGGHALEVSMASSRAGFVQLFYGDDSGGMGEATSSRMPVETSTTARRYRLALPVGKHRELRLDPLDRPGSVTIESIRIVTSSGRSVRAIALSELKPQLQIQTTNLREGRLEIQTTADGDDPQLALTLDPPLEIRLSWRQRFPVYWVWAAGIFAAFAVVLIGLDRLPHVRRGLAHGAVAMVARPVKALAIIAAAIEGRPRTEA